METDDPHILTNLSDPGALRDGDLTLILSEITAPRPDMGFVPAYHFHLCRDRVLNAVGKAVLRIGWTRNLLQYGGHIGYSVDPAHRGHRFASRAVGLLLPIAWRHGLPEVWITCNPDNLASIRTIERAGGIYEGNVLLPPDSDMALRGETSKNRYKIPRPRR